MAKCPICKNELTHLDEDESNIEYLCNNKTCFVDTILIFKKNPLEIKVNANL